MESERMVATDYEAWNVLWHMREYKGVWVTAKYKGGSITVDGKL